MIRRVLELWARVASPGKEIYGILPWPKVATLPVGSGARREDNQREWRVENNKTQVTKGKGESKSDRTPCTICSTKCLGASLDLQRPKSRPNSGLPFGKKHERIEGIYNVRVGLVDCAHNGATCHGHVVQHLHDADRNLRVQP